MAPMELRSYLIALLECDADEAAEQRLALRDEWRQSHGLSNASIAKPKPAVASDRVAEWTGLEQIWERFNELSSDVKVTLKPWLDSPWSDIRSAAERVVRLRRQRGELVAICPAGLKGDFFDRLLKALVRPESLRQAMLRGLGHDLASSHEATVAFREFLRHAQKSFPELGLYDIVEEAKLAASPLKALKEPEKKRPRVSEKESSQKNSWPVWTGVFIGTIVIKLALVGSQSKPPAVNKFPEWAPANRWPGADTRVNRPPDGATNPIDVHDARVKDGLLDVLYPERRKLDGVPDKTAKPLDPNDPLTKAAILSTEILLGRPISVQSATAPADATRPANVSADKEQP